MAAANGCMVGLRIMNSKPAKLFAVMFCFALLAACGQKGPLFLPGVPSTISSPVPGQPPAPAPVEDSEEDSKEQADNIE